MGLKRFLLVLLLFILASGMILPRQNAEAQTPTPPDVQTAFNSMTPEERVGQLFLVNFNGTDTSPQSQIYNLIVQYHVGGFFLSASNDNFTAAPNTLNDAYDLTTRLQRLEWEAASTPSVDSATGQPAHVEYVPLLIGISQEGNGYPTDQILSGLTPLPSEMAIGATWDTGLAQQVGEIQGRELAALGFNLYLGPSLDVLESPNPAGYGDMGTRVFGGDPYWVAEMGRAYVVGLHLGSENRTLIIAKHFPGLGGTNRISEEEIPTVRKSLEQLKQIELAPFFAVTGNAPTKEATVDGLLVSHIRYQGFQGNIRATTRPVSLDAQALTDILALPQFAAWRGNGGLMVSDNLGTQAMREFYSPGGGLLPASTVARDAFLAGNDILYLGQIVSSDISDPYQTTIDILEFFDQKYHEDPAFAQRVDAAVLRILTMKDRLYKSFSIYRVTPQQKGLNELGNSTAVTLEAATRSASLISPEPKELMTILPAPPQVRQRLVFITDKATFAQCSTCPLEDVPAVNALQQAILRFYGPEGDNQTSTFLVSSYSFDYLQAMLDNQVPPYIEGDLKRAGWIILSISDSSRGQAQLISRFLRERQDLLREKKVILFSFGAPYYFDSTDISHITAYFALYSKQAPFIDVAARLLFHELTSTGASPVSIPGTGYDLISVMSPDPDQIITLSLDLKPVAIPTGTVTIPEPTPIPLFKIGDTIAIRTGVILDHNGHPVPDGTVVQLSLTLTGEGGGILQQVNAVTTQGVALASFGLDKPGLLEIRAASEPATVSEVLQLDVSQSGPVAVTVVVPQLAEPVELTTPSVLNAPEKDGFISTNGYPRFNSWFLTMLFIAASVWLGYWFGNRLLKPRAALRLALGILTGGLLAYNYLSLGLPGSAAWTLTYKLAGVISFVFMGELIGFGAGWVWIQRE
jgi:beta-N-acetylhexosaminidase